MDHLRVPRYRAEHGLDIAEANTAYPMHLVSEEDLNARDQQPQSRQIDINDAYTAHVMPVHDSSHPGDVRTPAPPQYDHERSSSFRHPIYHEQFSMHAVSTPRNEPGSSAASPEGNNRLKKKKKSSSRSGRSKRPEGYMYDYGGNSPSGGQPAAAYMYSYTPAPLPPLPRVVDGSAWEAYLFSTSMNSAYAGASAVAAQYDSLAATYANWNAVAAHGYHASQPAAGDLAQAETSGRQRHDSISVSDSDGE